MVFFPHISAALFILRSRSRATAAAAEDEFLQCNNGPVIQHGQIQVLVGAWQGFDFLAGFGATKTGGKPVGLSKTERELGFPKQVFHRSPCFVFFLHQKLGFNSTQHGPNGCQRHDRSI
jgi:hypothetical protein